MAVRTGQTKQTVTISRWRINAMLLVALVLVGRVVFQLGNLQVIQHNDLSSRARREIDATKTINPSRGTIRDSKGNVLALDVERESLYIVPQQIDQKTAPKLALALAGLLGMPAPQIQGLLQDTSRYWVAVKRWLEPEIAERIAKLDEPGLHLVYEPRRFYPQGDYAAQVIGAVNLEGTGISGVEAFYDTALRGITGTVTAEWDPVGNPIWINPPQTKPSSDGSDLELTLDPLVQHVIETELRQAVEKFRPTGATVIVMDPKTGAILGMASYPSFDPNRYYSYPEEVYNQNPAISALYEPGSTFKVLTVGSGLQSRTITADTVVNDTGVVQRYGWSLGNWNRAGNGPIDPGKVLYYSSNVGALLLNEINGPENFYKTVNDFGYGQPTGVDMSGEASGLVYDQNSPLWDPVRFDTNAYGQGIAVTPLQQVRMIAAVGNNGRLMQPYIVQKRCKDGECVVTQPQEAGQPFEPGVAWTLRRMLVHSANHYAPIVWGGYNDTWLVPGYEVCAKTGTSDVSDGANGYTGRVIGSVVGLAPAEDSRYAILVKIDQPEGDAYGLVSAVPVFQAIADQLLRYARVPPNPALVDPGQVIGAVAP